MRIVILNFVDQNFKSGYKKIPSKNFSIDQAIKKLVKSFQNDWPVCRKRENKLKLAWSTK